MPNADIMMVAFVGGTPVVYDLYATTEAQPNFDAIQDVVLVAGSMVGATMYMEIERLLNTSEYHNSYDNPQFINISLY